MIARIFLLITMVLLAVGNAYGEAVWQQLSYGKIPSNAVPGGEPNSFICRDLKGVPGRLEKGRCYATWDGKQYAVDHYEGLSMAPGTYEWRWYKGYLPDQAVIGGNQGYGKDIYICRSPNKDEYTGSLSGSIGSVGIGSLVKQGPPGTGKFAPWTSTCYIGIKGFEAKTKSFLVLVEKKPGYSPKPGISGAKLVGEPKNDTKTPLFMVGPVAGTILPKSNNATVAALAQSSNTFPQPIEPSRSDEALNGMLLISSDGGKINLQLSYEYSASRPHPIYAGAFVYDENGTALDVGYIPIAVSGPKGQVTITLSPRDSDLEARYVVPFLMESGQKPFINGHFDFAYTWSNGQLLVSGQKGKASPIARADLCNAYATKAVELYDLATKKNLPNIFPPVWSRDFSQHYQWCLKANKLEIYQGHQLRVGYLEQMLPGEFSGNNVKLPGDGI
jgi:hypothetical protein